METSVGLKIRQIRMSRGWKQAVLGAHCHPPCTQQYISKLESGSVLPSRQKLAAIALALEISMADLESFEPSEHRIAQLLQDLQYWKKRAIHAERTLQQITR